MLLSSEPFKHVVNLQPIEIKNKNKNSFSAGTSNKNTTSAVDSTEPHAEFQLPITSAEHRPSVGKLLILLKKVKNTNRADDLCIQICAYLKAPSKKKKLIVHLNSCRANDGLLMKKNCLWVPKGKNSCLRLKVIKKMHDQPIVSHPGTKQMLNMICRYYY